MAQDAGAKVRCSAIVHTQENVTISSGAITVTSSYVRVLTEGSASSDDLDTINGGVAGQVLYLHQQLSTKDVTLKDGTEICFSWRFCYESCSRYDSFNIFSGRFSLD